MKPQLQDHRAHLYGSEPGRSTDDIAEVLRVCTPKVGVWNKTILVASCDIEVVFPSMRHDDI